MTPEIDIKLTDIFRRHPFTISAEVMPPRNGTGLRNIFSQIERLVGAGTQYLSVTKGAGGSLRGGSLPIAQAIHDRFEKPCVAHFTCRDLAPEEVENQLVDHHLFGIRNILALRGDPPDGVSDWSPRPGSYEYAYQLVEQIRSLNDGRFLERKGFELTEREPTSFCIGVACYPDHPEPTERLAFFERKVKAGAEFAITQMIFDPEAYARFLDQTSHLQIPILPGTRLLKSKAQAQRMASRFQVKLCPDFLAALPDTDAEARPEHSIAAFLDLTERLRSFGAPGIHIFVMSDTEIAVQALRHLAATVDPAALTGLDRPHELL